MPFFAFKKMINAFNIKKQTFSTKNIQLFSNLFSLDRQLALHLVIIRIITNY